jgi:hypothetical protein
MSMYLFPKTVVADLDRQRRTFFWQGGSTKRKYHLIKWEIICKNKNKGGLGIKDIRNTTRNYLICDAFSATFSENVTNVHCSPKQCDDFFNSSRFYDVFLFSSRMCIEAQNTATIC